MLGSACAGTCTPDDGEPRGPGIWLRVAAVAAVLLAVSVVTPYLAERYIDSAYGGWVDDPERAQDDLNRAGHLNPHSVEPRLAEGGIARAAGQREQAITAFE